jgi:uncharacterized cupin superfamily protein
MSVESAIKFGIGQVDLSPSPIYRDWILEGNPVARNKLLSSSADGYASSYIWDCTAGRFNWFYMADETIYVIEGAVVIKDMAGAARRLGAGDTIFFPAGTHAEWYIEKYIRKFALIRTPVPRSVIYAKRCYRFLKRLVGAGRREDLAPTFPSG